MSEEPSRQLIHQVNNLLAVIRVQVEAARAVGTPDSAQTALDLILRAAERTEEEVRRFRSPRT
jgi:hypothetical protein